MDLHFRHTILYKNFVFSYDFVSFAFLIPLSSLVFTLINFATSMMDTGNSLAKLMFMAPLFVSFLASCLVIALYMDYITAILIMFFTMFFFVVKYKVCGQRYFNRLDDQWLKRRLRPSISVLFIFNLFYMSYLMYTAFMTQSQSKDLSYDLYSFLRSGYIISVFITEVDYFVQTRRKMQNLVGQHIGIFHEEAYYKVIEKSFMEQTFFYWFILELVPLNHETARPYLGLFWYFFVIPYFGSVRSIASDLVPGGFGPEPARGWQNASLQASAVFNWVLVNSLLVGALTSWFFYEIFGQYTNSMRPFFFALLFSMQFSRHLMIGSLVEQEASLTMYLFDDSTLPRPDHALLFNELGDPDLTQIRLRPSEGRE